jgi:hypothetical protein
MSEPFLSGLDLSAALYTHVEPRVGIEGGDVGLEQAKLLYQPLSVGSLHCSSLGACFMHVVVGRERAGVVRPSIVCHRVLTGYANLLRSRKPYSVRPHSH